MIYDHAKTTETSNKTTKYFKNLQPHPPCLYHREENNFKTFTPIDSMMKSNV